MGDQVELADLLFQGHLPEKVVHAALKRVLRSSFCQGEGGQTERKGDLRQTWNIGTPHNYLLYLALTLYREPNLACRWFVLHKLSVASGV
jgi:hypothetical protein